MCSRLLFQNPFRTECQWSDQSDSLSLHIWPRIVAFLCVEYSGKYIDSITCCYCAKYERKSGQKHLEICTKTPWPIIERSFWLVIKDNVLCTHDTGSQLIFEIAEDIDLWLSNLIANHRTCQNPSVLRGNLVHIRCFSKRLVPYHHHFCETTISVGKIEWWSMLWSVGEYKFRGHHARKTKYQLNRVQTSIYHC